jgi:hypothetical protein
MAASQHTKTTKDFEYPYIFRTKMQHRFDKGT